MNRSEVPNRDLSIAQFVRERRRSAKLTQHELADLAGVGKRFIVELEEGKQTVRLDKVNQVLRVFGRRAAPTEIPTEARQTLPPEA